MVSPWSCPPMLGLRTGRSIRRQGAKYRRRAYARPRSHPAQGWCVWRRLRLEGLGLAQCVQHDLGLEDLVREADLADLLRRQQYLATLVMELDHGEGHRPVLRIEHEVGDLANIGSAGTQR